MKQTAKIRRLEARIKGFETIKTTPGKSGRGAYHKPGSYSK